MNIQELREAVEKTIYLSEIDFQYVIQDLVEVCEESEEIENIEEIKEAFIQAINETDVIYYSNAMEFLMKEDTSLNESMEIAAELGYTCENLNSETLATLLKQQRMLEELSEIF